VTGKYDRRSKWSNPINGIDQPKKGFFEGTNTQIIRIIVASTKQTAGMIRIPNSTVPLLFW
jgi:hypothetical protein